MNCPNCGHKFSTVVYIKQKTDFTLRQRLCANCETKFRTTEVLEKKDEDCSGMVPLVRSILNFIPLKVLKDAISKIETENKAKKAETEINSAGD